MSNTSIMEATIKYLIETKRFDDQLFWCFPNVLFLEFFLFPGRYLLHFLKYKRNPFESYSKQ